MAVAAILLLSIVPTVSQLVAGRAPHAGHVHHAASHAEHSGRAGRDLAGSGGTDDECWRKCGYCDFLVHAPVLGTIAYMPAFAPAPAPIPIGHEPDRPSYAEHFPAAQPRGPPASLA